MRVRPNLPLMVTVLSWGFNFVALKVVYAEMPPPAVALLRWFVMVALLVGVCLVRKESIWPDRDDVLRFLGLGALSMGIYMVLFLEGMAETTAADGAIVMSAAPLVTYFMACALRQERFSTATVAGAAIAFTGVALVILGGAVGEHGTVRGNLIVLLGVLVWSTSVVWMRPLLAKYSPVQALTMSMPGALPVLLIYGFRPLGALNFSAISANGWFMFGTVSVMSGVVAFICFYRGIRDIGASGATLYQYFVPVVAAFFSWTVLGKPLVASQFGGLTLILAGVAYAGRARARAALA